MKNTNKKQLILDDIEKLMNAVQSEHKDNSVIVTEKTLNYCLSQIKKDKK